MDVNWIQTTAFSAEISCSPHYGNVVDTYREKRAKNMTQHVDTYRVLSKIEWCPIMTITDKNPANDDDKL